MTARLKTTIRIPAKYMTELKKEAKTLGISVNALINIILNKHIKGGE
jgi:predicted HicB family RNase H-like nuclease